MNTSTTNSARTPVEHDAIVRRAHEIWNTRGQPVGQDVDIWLEAERQLQSDRGDDNSVAVQPAARGVTKARRSGRSLSEKVEDALEDHGSGHGQGGHTQILKQTT